MLGLAVGRLLSCPPRSPASKAFLLPPFSASYVGGMWRFGNISCWEVGCVILGPWVIFNRKSEFLLYVKNGSQMLRNEYLRIIYDLLSINQCYFALQIILRTGYGFIKIWVWAERLFGNWGLYVDPWSCHQLVMWLWQVAPSFWLSQRVVKLLNYIFSN